MMTPNPQPDAGRDRECLKSRLEAFETALLTPIVPGENVAWRREIQQTWNELVPHVREQLDHGHQQQFDEICESDPELFKRVVHLQEDDQKLRAQIDRLAESVAELSEKLPSTEKRPIQTEQVQEELIKDGLAFVIGVRRQETTVTTWFQEAFNRERGPVD